MPPTRRQSVSLLGQRVDGRTYAEVAGDIVDHLKGDPPKPMSLDAANTMTLAAGCLDDELGSALSSYDSLLPDGTPLVWCANAKGANLPDRVFGPYLTDLVLTSVPPGTRVAVVGGDAELHDRLREIGGRRFPNAAFVSFDDAVFTTVSEAEVEASVNRARRQDAKLILVCLGVPKQYLWVSRAQAHCSDQVLLSIGGALDFVLGVKAYAPGWMQRNGLGWVFRIYQEPRRLFMRYVKFNPLFIYFVLRDEVMSGNMKVGNLVRAEIGRRGREPAARSRGYSD